MEIFLRMSVSKNFGMETMKKNWSVTENSETVKIFHEFSNSRKGKIFLKTPRFTKTGKIFSWIPKFKETVKLFSQIQKSVKNGKNIFTNSHIHENG